MRAQSLQVAVRPGEVMLQLAAGPGQAVLRLMMSAK